MSIIRTHPRTHRLSVKEFIATQSAAPSLLLIDDRLYKFPGGDFLGYMDDLIPSKPLFLMPRMQSEWERVKSAYLKAKQSQAIATTSVIFAGLGF